MRGTGIGAAGFAPRANQEITRTTTLTDAVIRGAEYRVPANASVRLAFRRSLNGTALRPKDTYSGILIMERVFITASRRLGRDIGLRKTGTLLLVREYGSIATVTISVPLLLIAANLTAPPWWLATAGWIPVAIYVVRGVSHLPKDDPRQGAALITVVAFFLLGGFGMSSLTAFFRALFHPSGENIIRFCISRGFLASTTIYFAVACLSYRRLLEASEEELDQYRSALKNLPRKEHEDVETSVPASQSRAISPETQRRLESWKRLVVRGRRLRKLRESANSPNGSDANKE